jgi:uncharacterized membrane protein YedE/YeeE
VSAPRPYTNPYVAGVCLGLVLLASYVLAGRGLGASGGFASVAAGAVAALAPHYAAGNAYFERYLAGADPWTDWLVIELIGVVIGGFGSALLAGRLGARIDRGPGLTGGARLAFAAIGGAAMGLGAVLARGCTSGQALTGGALLSVGSWIFMIAAFAAGYLAAPLARRLW